MLKYSIIIPHKNIPNLLERCIMSIPQRDDIQIIVVDDNSSSENRFLANKACEKHSKVTYFQDDLGKGAGHARNVGLENARGEWVIFSDSDDFFDEGFWHDVDFLLDGCTADIIYFKDRAVNSDTLQPIPPRNGNNNNITAFLEKKKNAEDRLRFFHTVPWGKVFRRAFLTKVKVTFEEVIAANDVMFSTKTGSLARSIDAKDKVMYVVSLRGGSLTTTKNLSTFRCRYEVAIRQNLYVSSIGKQRYAFNVITGIRNAKQYGWKEVCRTIKTLLKSGVNPFNCFRRLGD